MSFLDDFVRYMKTRTDAPPDFHVHGGMVALAAALGNQVWCDGWTRPLFPNLWVVNIAPSGFGKSTTLDMAQSLLHRAGLGERSLPSAFSQEALIRRMSEDSQAVWFHQEFAAFMGTLSRDYNSGAMQTLTEWFDVPDEYRRILGVAEPKTFVIRKPCISILGASSPDWFAATYRESALRGGFLARFLFCPSTEVGKYIGHPGPRLDSAEAPLAGHLRQVAQLCGRFDISGVLEEFRAWDYESRERLRKDCPPEFSGMRSRTGLLVLKAAMLFHVSKDATSLVLDSKDLSNAIKYVQNAQAKAETFLTDEVASDRKGELRIRVLDILRRAGGHIQRGQALKRSKVDAQEFRGAVETLVQTGDVAIQHEPGSKAEWLVLRSPFPVNSQRTVNDAELNGHAVVPVGLAVSGERR